jgi:hypothetical protein
MDFFVYCLRKQSVDAELSLIVEGSLGDDDARREHDQALEGPAIQWLIVNKRAFPPLPRQK